MAAAGACNSGCAVAGGKCMAAGGACSSGHAAVGGSHTYSGHAQWRRNSGSGRDAELI